MFFHLSYSSILLSVFSSFLVFPFLSFFLTTVLFCFVVPLLLLPQLQLLVLWVFDIEVRGGGGSFFDQDPLACRGAETFFLYLGISIWTSKCKIACLFSFFSVGSSLVFSSFFSSCNQTKHLYGKYQSSKLWQMGNWFLSLFIYHFTYASLFSSNLFISSISKSISIFFPCWTNCPNVSS